MKPLQFRHIPMLLVLIVLLSCSKNNLYDQFRNPPDSAKPMTWWHWMNGNVSKEGITADLEALHEAGIGGVMAFNINFGEKGPVRYNTPEWRDMMVHASKEARRLGLQFYVHACDGWNESGGPWIKPVQAMQKIVWSDTLVTGGKPFAGNLPQPPVIHSLYQDFMNKTFQDRFLPQPSPGQKSYRDIAILAVKTSSSPETKLSQFHPKISISQPPASSGQQTLNFKPETLNLIDHNFETFLRMPGATPDNPQVLTFELKEPATFRSLFLAANYVHYPGDGELQVSTDGKEFTKVCTLPKPIWWTQFVPQITSFSPATGRFFRLVFADKGHGGDIALLEVDLSGRPYLSSFPTKAGYGFGLNFLSTPQDVFDSGSILKGDSVIDLTARAKDGYLQWEVPAGNWKILRIGHCPTGVKNYPATAEGVGYECDKLDQEVVKYQYNQVIGQLLADKDFRATGVLFDSWEVFYQNWTPRMPDEFRKRCGYSLEKYLPVLSGYVVENPEISERFLWDYRRVLGELLVENYYGTYGKLAHDDQMKFAAEIGSGGGSVVTDFFRAKAQTDLIMGEFWLSPDPKTDVFSNDCKEASSAAHVYGRNVVAAEAFTCGPHKRSIWYETPYEMKVQGDRHFCGGVNQLVFHTSSHQPFTDKFPGMTMGPHGIHFERTNTWIRQSKAWLQYLSRCQFMLQQGRFAADACYFLGEETPYALKERNALSPAIPDGYDYDACNADVILNRMSVRDGKIVLPEGQTYPFLILPGSETMTVELLLKLKQLIEGGAVVVGPKPLRSTGLVNYPQSDEQVVKLADEIWGDCDGLKVKEHSFGKGKVVWGRSLAELFGEIRLTPDFSWKTGSDSVPLQYVHRILDDGDLYFVSNQARKPVQAECTFRTTGKQPELWNPETGERIFPASWKIGKSTTTLVLNLKDSESVFVVFRGKSKNEPVYEALPDGSFKISAEPGLQVNPNGGYLLETEQSGEFRYRTASGIEISGKAEPVPQNVEISGNWEVEFMSPLGEHFKASFDTLVSWTKNPDRNIRYFSGTATYRLNFVCPTELIRENREIYLELGTVKEFAQVRLNGKDMGIIWKPPFTCLVTNTLKPGGNELEVEITNLWPNRLIGDENLPENERKTWYAWRPKLFSKDSPLVESGLLGPVRLTTKNRISLNR